MRKLLIFLFMTIISINTAVAEHSTIKIHVNLTSMVGNPSWLLMIRDVEHNRNIPFLFDFASKTDNWTASSPSKNYLIQGSTLNFNVPGKKSITNFCSIESDGRIVRGRNTIIQISGNLKPHSRDLKCTVSSYKTS